MAMRFDSLNSFIFLSIIIYLESILSFLIYLFCNLDQRFPNGVKFTVWLVHALNSECLQHDLRFTRV